jgi:UDP-glucose 4-epimerase
VKLMTDANSVEFGGSGEELRDWIHVDDVVAMMHQVAGLASVRCPVFNGGSGVAVRVRDIVALISNSLQRTARVNFSGIRRPGDPMVLVANVSRIEAAGAGCRVPTSVGVQRYADWFKIARHE